MSEQHEDSHPEWRERLDEAGLYSLQVFISRQRGFKVDKVEFSRAIAGHPTANLRFLSGFCDKHKNSLTLKSFSKNFANNLGTKRSRPMFWVSLLRETRCLTKCRKFLT